MMTVTFKSIMRSKLPKQLYERAERTTDFFVAFELGADDCLIIGSEQGVVEPPEATDDEEVTLSPTATPGESAAPAFPLLE